ncbi:MAG: hypothetical protein NC823_02460 [Candidatus Omnitrophica bacterium]|nr:hypothetical protein [Candidatus Omnitrophota bacterium]
MPFNERMAAIVKKYRPDIITISEPVLRCPAVYGKARGCDIAQHWSYAWPSPRSLLFYVDSLVATKKYLNQKISHDVQILWKKGWVGPEDMTPSPDVIRESLWINFSRPLDSTFFWGTHLAINDERDPKETCHPGVYPELARFSEQVIRPFGPLVKKLTSPNKPVAFLVSTASELFVTGWRYAPGIHSMNFYDALQAANIPTDVIYEADVKEDVLEKRKYQAVVLSYCQTLPQSVYQRLVAFAQKGGKIFADPYLEAEIPGVKRLSGARFEFVQELNYASASSGKTDVDRVKKRMDEIVAYLREVFQGVYQPEIKLDSPDILYNRLEGEKLPVWVLINDRRQAGEWAGRFKTIHDAGLPQKFKVSLNLKNPGNVLYNLRQHRQVSGQKKDGWLTFIAELAPAEGTYLAEYPEPIGGVSLEARKKARKGERIPVKITITGRSGKILPGLQPLWIEVFDGAGQRTEYSDYYCAENGSLEISFSVAENEPAGFWRIEAKELAGGNQAACYLEITAKSWLSGETNRKQEAGESEIWDRD